MVAAASIRMQTPGLPAAAGRAFCYTSPLLIGKPVYAGMQTLASCLDEAGPLAAAVLNYLLTYGSHDCPARLNLSRTAADLRLSGDREGRVRLWRTIDKLSTWRLIFRNREPHRYGPLLTVQEAEVCTELSGRVLADVRSVLLTVNRELILDGMG